MECMENVWNKFFNLIIQNDTSIECKIDVQDICKARKALSLTCITI